MKLATRLLLPVLTLCLAGTCLAQATETPIGGGSGSGGCGTTVSGEITDLGPDGSQGVTFWNPTIDLEFFSVAKVTNDTNNAVTVAQAVELYEAIEDPFHVGVYTKGAMLDVETDVRTVADCTEMTNWKVGKTYTFGDGDYFIEGKVVISISPDLFAVLDVKSQLFHVINDSASSN